MKPRIALKRVLFVVISVALLCLARVLTQEVQAKANTTLPEYITAIYTGDSCLVGSLINRDDILVQAFYEDESVVDITDYSLSTERVNRDGENEIAVVYRGRRSSFFVTGKRVSSLSAFYVGEDVSVGNAVSKTSVYVYASYTDGSSAEVKDFTIASPIISRVGVNRINIIYGGKAAAIEVTGRVSGTVNSILVTYVGGDVMLGSPIKRDDIYVTALYTDGSSETIVNYQLSKETPDMIGVNTVIVTYKNRTASFIVTGYDRSVEKITARYTGSGVEVGKDVRKTDVEVTATFTDGTVEKVTDFDLPTPTIYFVGSHVKTVHFMGQTADIYVIGIEAMPTSYANASEFTVSNGRADAFCRIAVPSGLDSSIITGESVRKASVSQVVPRAIRRSDFIAFEIVAETEGEDELPLEMKITVPDGYDPDDCVLYYTPNRKTIVARMNSFVNPDGELEVTIHKTGTFLLAYEPEPEEDE